MYVQAHDILSPVAVVKFISVTVFAKTVSSNKYKMNAQKRNNKTLAVDTCC